MTDKIKTSVHRRKDNGKEWGYKPVYIMIDIETPYTILSNMAEATDETDIPNTRRRAIYATKKILGRD